MKRQQSAYLSPWFFRMFVIELSGDSSGDFRIAGTVPRDFGYPVPLVFLS